MGYFDGPCWSLGSVEEEDLVGDWIENRVKDHRLLDGKKKIQQFVLSPVKRRGSRKVVDA